ncbi:Nitroreductase [Muriicola jejuensis]|uniref:NAD(P)H-dependent oxidoreductase n=1 Tax=Muriicola jejuensis TaxID=504488 RepID=A0A6P0UFN6_9FLAO|nr:nitroreductase family protein [Muriicola jejuensis]NER11432.1 NAD(P)H-dependent oxidoreductase [Muriicola jejuensis]SMP20826.1 Nitroreductase [Muriicola jejuensis]
MDSIEKLKWRYAVKKFDSGAILEQEKIDRLIHAFNLTATSYGLQPIRLVVLKNKEIQGRLVKHTYGQQQVGQASHVLVICIETNVDQEYITQYFERVKSVRGTPEQILTPFKKALVDSFSQKQTEEIRQWATNQAYLAMGNLLTVCALEEIDACPMEGFDPGSYDEVLDLKPQNLTSVLVLPVGKRAEDDFFSTLKKVRRDLSETIIHIE